jgi:hypothetical protein
MILSVHQPQYLPWLGYFDKIDRSDAFVFLDNVQYKTREFQNRNKIRTKDSWMWLTVPVKACTRQKIDQVKIGFCSDWRRKHWNSLQTWYGQAAFFRDHSEFFAQTYKGSWEKLLDLNIHIINYILSEFKIKTRTYRESELDIRGTRTDRIIEICKKLKADTYLSGSGGKNYLEENKFIDAGIKLQYQQFNHPVYEQCNAGLNNFMPFMSIVDMLFNQGKASLGILRQANMRIPG